MKLTKEQAEYNKSRAAGFTEYGIKILDANGGIMTEEQVVEFLNNGGEVYQFSAPLLETDEEWMVMEDEEGAPDVEYQGIVFAITGDTAWFQHRINHIAEGSPLERTLEEISARDLRKAFNVEDDDALVNAMKETFQFQAGIYVHSGWDDLKDYLKKHDVHFVEKTFNYAPIE